MRIKGHYLEVELRRLIKVGNDRLEYPDMVQAEKYVYGVLDTFKTHHIIEWYSVGGNDNNDFARICAGLSDTDDDQDRYVYCDSIEIDRTVALTA